MSSNEDTQEKTDKQTDNPSGADKKSQDQAEESLLSPDTPEKKGGERPVSSADTKDPNPDKSLKEEDTSATDNEKNLPPIDLSGVNRKSLLEALLFAEDKPISLEKLSDLLQIGGREVRVLIEELKQDYIHRSSGLQVNEISHGFILSTSAELGKYLRYFYNRKDRPSFSRAAIETLAIIAYKQPVTRIEIEEIRGAAIGNSVKILMERKLIKIEGRKNVAGHPLLYGTTREFLMYFGLKSLEALPTIKEIREMEIN